MNVDPSDVQSTNACHLHLILDKLIIDVVCHLRFKCCLQCSVRQFSDVSNLIKMLLLPICYTFPGSSEFVMHANGVAASGITSEGGFC
jgi:hypothetical protein